MSFSAQRFCHPINYSHNYVLDGNKRQFMSRPAAWGGKSVSLDQVAPKLLWQMFLFLAKRFVRSVVFAVTSVAWGGVFFWGCSRWGFLWRYNNCSTKKWCAPFIFLTPGFRSACQIHFASLCESPSFGLVLHLPPLRFLSCPPPPTHTPLY